MKAKLVPLYFEDANERERKEFQEQLIRLRDYYQDVAEFLKPVCVGEKIPKADAIVFPQLIFSAYRQSEEIKQYQKPVIAFTSRFGTVEMWDWEIVTFLRGKDITVYSPYNIDLGKVVIRSLAVKSEMENGAKFLMFQDTPGEGMQANIFKRFYWWEAECAKKMEETFGVQIIYRSYAELGKRAKEIPDEKAKKTFGEWNVDQEGVCQNACLGAAKLYLAVKEVIEEIGEVKGVGANCLNESFYSDSTPCLAFNMLFEKDDIIWACEGDIMTLLSTYILYRSLEAPIMMTNLYPFLVGMAALAHEKIKEFPDVKDSDNCALGVHCGYFGFAPRAFCDRWKMRPKVLEIVDDNAIVIDCEFPKGSVVLAKIYPDFKKISVIEAEIEDYVNYPGSDCRNGAIIRYHDGEKVMEELCSHHTLIITGKQKARLLQIAKTFDWEVKAI